MKFYLETFTISQKILETKLSTKNLKNLIDTEKFRDTLLSLIEGAFSSEENCNSAENQLSITVHIVKVELSGQQEKHQIAMFFEHNSENFVRFYPLFNFEELINTDERNSNQLQLFVRACDDSFLIELINIFPRILSNHIYTHVSGLSFIHCLILERKILALYHLIEQYQNLSSVINQLTASGFSPLLLAIQHQLNKETTLLANLKNCDFTIRIPDNHINEKFRNLDAIDLAFECFPEGLNILLSATPKANIEGQSYSVSSNKRFIFDTHDPKHPVKRAIKLYRTDNRFFLNVMPHFPDFDLLLFLQLCDDNMLIELVTGSCSFILNLKHEDKNYGTCYFIHGLIIENKEHVFEYLLKQSPSLLHTLTSNGLSLLHLAVIHGRYEIITLITQQTACDHQMLFLATPETHANVEFRKKTALDFAFDKFPSGIEMLLSTGKYQFKTSEPGYPLTRAVNLYKENPEPLSHVLMHYDLRVWHPGLIYNLFEMRDDHISLKLAFFQLGRNLDKQSSNSFNPLNDMLFLLCQQKIEESSEVCHFLLAIARYYIVELGANFGTFSQRNSTIKKLKSKTFQDRRFKDEINKICNTALVLLVQEYLLTLNPTKDSQEISLVNTVKENLLKPDSRRLNLDKLNSIKALASWIQQNKAVISGIVFSSPNPLLAPLNNAIQDLETYQRYYQAISCRYDSKSGCILLSFLLEEEGEIILWLQEIFIDTTIFKNAIPTTKADNDNNLNISKKIRSAGFTRGRNKFTVSIPADEVMTVEKIVERLKKQQIISENIVNEVIEQSQKLPEFHFDMFTYLILEMYSQENARKIKWEIVKNALEKYPQEVDPSHKPLPPGIGLKDLHVKLVNERYNGREQTLLHLAARDNQADMVLKLLEIDPKTATLADEGDNLPLHTLINRDSIDALKAYLTANHSPSLWNIENGEKKSPLQMAIYEYENGRPEALRLYIYYTGHIPADFMEKTYALNEKFNQATTTSKNARMYNYVKEAFNLIRSMLDDQKTRVFQQNTQMYINRVLTDLCLQQFVHLEKQRTPLQSSLQAFEDTMLLIKDYIQCGAIFSSKKQEKPVYPFNHLFFNNPFYILNELKTNSSKNNGTSAVISQGNNDLTSDFLKIVELFTQVRKLYTEIDSRVAKNDFDIAITNKILDILHKKPELKSNKAIRLYEALCEHLKIGNYIEKSKVTWEQSSSTKIMALNLALPNKIIVTNNNGMGGNIIKKTNYPQWIEDTFQKISCFNLALREDKIIEDVTKIIGVILNGQKFTTDITLCGHSSCLVKISLEEDNPDIWSAIIDRLKIHRVISETQTHELCNFRHAIAKNLT